jgi:flagellin-like hook-associated protein FlgL
MSERITQSSISRQFLEQLQGRYSTLSRIQRELSSGQQLNAVEDDPVGYSYSSNLAISATSKMRRGTLMSQTTNSGALPMR